MKKFILLPVVIIVLIAALFIPFNKAQTVEIKYPFTLVFNELKPSKWQKWQPDLINAVANPGAVKVDSSTTGFKITSPGVIINAVTPDGFDHQVIKTVGNQSSAYSYVILPQKIAGNSVIAVTQKTNIFRLITGAVDKPNDMAYLKAYMNDTKAYYGFSIRKGKVLDSNIIVRRLIVPIKNKQAEIVKAQILLNEYVKQHNLTQVQPVMADIRNVSNDSAQVMIGIPVKEVPKTNGGFTFMQQPRNGNMLFTTFAGRYGDRKKLYNAMREYFANHSLSAPELPYEKFINNKIPLSDTSMVKMEVCYPIL